MSLIQLEEMGWQKGGKAKKEVENCRMKLLLKDIHQRSSSAEISS